MKDRLSKTLSRLKKEKIIKNQDEDIKQVSLNSYEIKVFRSLREKYDLSLSINESKGDDSKENELSNEAKVSLERINRGESFKP